MSIFNAMLTSVSGLKAQSFAIENVSGNIANAQTTGYKRVDTRFVDLIPEAPAGREIAGSVGAFARATTSLQGQLLASESGTHVAIDGSGLFVVQRPDAVVNGQPSFGAAELYTRRGDFDLDRNGYLVNGSGHYLRGTPIDATTGALSGSGLGALKIAANDPPRATTRIDYRANLASTPKTASHDPAVPGSGLLDPAGYAGDPRAAGTGIVTGADQSRFLSQSLFGGQIAVTDSNGDAATLQLRWAKTADAAGATPDTWELFYLVDENAAGGQTAWRNAGQALTFDASGQLTSPSSFTIPAVTIGTRSFGAIAFDTGSGGLTQYADAAGQATPEDIRQDGFAAGALQRLSVAPDGRLVAAYSNGRTAAVAQIGVARFAAVNALGREDGGAFSATADSGAAVYGLGGSTVSGGALEQSNTDIAEEFSKMIVSQQAYNANTRVISAAQQMLQELINVVR